MFEVYLTNIHATDGRVAELLTLEDRAEAHELCTTLQPYLRDGIEAHFVSTS